MKGEGKLVRGCGRSFGGGGGGGCVGDFGVGGEVEGLADLEATDVGDFVEFQEVGKTYFIVSCDGSQSFAFGDDVDGTARGGCGCFVGWRGFLLP